MTFPKFQWRLLSTEIRWELTRYNFCTPISHTKRCAKAFIHRNPMKKVAFLMSRRHARYKSEEIAPWVGGGGKLATLRGENSWVILTEMISNCLY